MRAAIYARVSTQHKGQETANQLLQLRECCHAQNLSIFREYEDHESGAKYERSGFQEMLRDAAARRFDVLFFWSLDRLTREGTLATLKYMELLETYGVRWRSLTEPWIDSAGPFRDPRGTPEKRPMRDTSKPANGIRPRQSSYNPRLLITAT